MPNVLLEIQLRPIQPDDFPFLMRVSDDSLVYTYPEHGLTVWAPHPTFQRQLYATGTGWYTQPSHAHLPRHVPV